MNINTNIKIKDSIATKILVIVLFLYLVITTSISLTQIWANYHYHKSNIINDINDIHSAFKNSIAVNLWRLNNEGLSASLKGILKIRTILGVKVITSDGKTIAIGRINRKLDLNMAGLDTSKTSMDQIKSDNYETFEQDFPIIYNQENETILLGHITLYSNSSVIIEQIRVHLILLIINVVLTLLTFSLALFWAIRRFIRVPLDTLARATEQVSLENLDKFSVNIKTSTHNELKALENAFNSMIDNLHHSMNERKQVEKEIEIFKTAVDSATDAVGMSTASGKHYYQNKAFDELFGKVNLIGDDPPKTLYVDTKVGREVFQTIMNGEQWTGEVQMFAADDRILDIYLRAYSIKDENGIVTNLVGVHNDITSRKKDEKELVKIKKLESVGILAGGIAHDFNNILSSILGNINMALHYNQLDPDTKQLLTDAEKASLRAKSLTQQLLTFAKGGEPVKETASLEIVIKDSADFVTHGHRSACEYHFPKNLWPAEIDKGQISQVIQNIVINSAHAMPEGGVIKISAENIPAYECKMKSDHVRITIKDNGIGMSAKTLEKIFDPYYSTKQKGSGLGLAIAQSIVNKHNGHISVSSTQEVGTTFTIYLPASKNAKISKEIPVQKFEQSTPLHILVMDDDVMLRGLVEKMLEKLGHHVELSAEGSETIKMYQKAIDEDKQFDLIIMDLTIPGGMGGKDAIQEILKINPKAKVIVSSGYSNDPIMANFKDYGFIAAIVKPYRIKELSQIISKIVK